MSVIVGQYLRVDVGRRFVRDVNRYKLDANDLIWPLSDGILLRCFFELEGTTNAWEPIPISENAILEFGLKVKGQENGALLAYSPNSKWCIAGDWNGTDRTEGKCPVRIDLHTKPLLDHFAAGNVDDVVCHAEICITEPGLMPVTIPFDVTILNDALKLGEAEAPEVSPDFASVNDMNAAILAARKPGNCRAYLENGDLYLWDIGEERFRRVGMNNGAYVPIED